MKRRPTRAIIAFTILAASLPLLGRAQDTATPTYLWWEAEAPATHANAKLIKSDADSPFGRVLSSHGRLEASAPEDPPMTASYRLAISTAGPYHLWARKFWRHGPFQWRFSGQNNWQACGRDVALHSSTIIMPDTPANWVYLGEVELDKGETTFEIESLDNSAGFLDCFLLIDGPFLPNGRLKPGEKSGKADTGHFAWEPDADPFAPSPIDLRYLNEDFAGQHGYIRRQGDHFVRGDGQRVRFWFTQCGNLIGMKSHMRDQHARRLAKYGVNMARFVMLDLFKTWREGDRPAFKRKLDELHQTVASLKRNGIYVYLGHLFWDTHVHSLHDNELPGLKKGQQATAALFFNEPLQAYYLDWVRDLMTPENPYTGLSLAEDPAVAVIEVQNESNTLFWTMNPENLPAHTLELIETAFAEYAKSKYGSTAAAIDHYGDSLENDDPRGGRLGVLGAYSMTTRGVSQSPRRASDQIAFLTQSQRQLYTEMKAAFRAMGIRKMVAASNWKTADPSNLGPLEHYSYTATDMINKNEYFSPMAIENPRFYLFEEGDAFIPLSAMRAPEIAAVLMTAQVADWPYLITENNWDEPNTYRVEWPFLVATYGSMAGIDGWNFFAYDTPMWYAGNNTWTVNTPEVLAQFPAYALMYRRGDVREGPPAVVERLPLERLYHGKPIALPEKQYKDAVWKKTLGGDPQVDFDSEIDPRAFFAGPVRLHLGAKERSVQTADLEELLDAEDGVIRNTNGQLEWRYGDGIVIADTPLSQGICGFLGEAGTVELSDVSLSMENEYGSLVAVSLDGLPLELSQRILLQAGTPDKAYGYQLEEIGDGGRRIVSLGGPPLNIEQVQAKVVLPGKQGHRVTALDPHGYPTDQAVSTQTSDAALHIRFPTDTLYLIVEAP